MHLTPTNLQLVILGQFSLREDLAFVLALVTKLNYISIFWMLSYSTIAGKFLLKHLHSFFLS